MFQSQAEKVKTGFWSLNPDKFSYLLFYLLILFLPTQLGKHFWPDFSYVYGLRLDYLSPTLYVTDILVILLFISFLPNLKKELLRIKTKNLFLFSLFVLTLFLGALFSKNMLAALFGLLKILEFSFLIFFVSVNFKKLNRFYLFLLIFTGIVFESILAAVQFINQSSLGGVFYFFGERSFNGLTPGIANASINGALILRPYGTFSHPNVLAGFLVIYMLLLLYFYKNKKLLNVLIFSGFVLGFLALMLTLGRIAILSFLFCLILLFGNLIFKKYKNRKTNVRIGKKVLLSSVLLIIVIFILLNGIIVPRFLQTTLSDRSLVQREQLMVQALNMFRSSPMFGVGINNFYMNINFQKEKNQVFLIQPVHNIFLLALSETGLAGFMFIIYVFYRALILTKNNKSLGPIIFLSLLSIIAIGMFDHYFFTLQQGQLLTSVVLGLAFSKKT